MTEKQTKYVKIHIPVLWRDFRNLKQYAEATGQPMSKIGRELIKKFLKEQGYEE